MPRKKSAARKSRELTQKAEGADNANSSQDVNQKIPISNTAAAAEAESNSESSESESEDEYGDLLTENVEKSIQNVLQAIKTDPKKLLDPEAKFFEESNTTVEKKKSDKPIYLKDYHRMNLLSGDYKHDDDNAYETIDGEKPFVVTEREERDQLLADINDAFESDSDNDFLKKKENKKKTSTYNESPALPDPNLHSEEFLKSFLSNEAWIPRKNDKAINLDQIDNEDEQDFDDAVEDFEKAYNFRYEDPNAAEIVSYARSQASLRRAKTNSRKRAREKKHTSKEQEKEEIESALQKKKTAKINKVMDRLSKIKEAVGSDVSDEVIEKVFGDSLMKDDFDDVDWDNRMAEIFNEEYYENEVTKPEWDEDDEIMADFHGKKNVDMSDDEEHEQDSEVKSKKEKLQEKKSVKKDKKSLKEKAQKIVEANSIQIREEVEEERGRSRGDDLKFKYREVSPESFGLSTREIFLADDQDLNKFISIKKFAPYKPKELALKDKRKFAKKKHLQQWRREVFKNKEGPARRENENDDEIWIAVDADELPEKKNKRKKREAR